MKIAYVSTYLPQQCGIATYTNYLVNGLQKLDEQLQIRIVAENKALSSENNILQVLPVWDRLQDYSKQIIKHTKGFDIIHIQHEYGIFQYDHRLVETIKGLDKKAKKIATIHCVKSEHFSEIKNIEHHTKQLADLLDVLIVHLPSQQSILQRIGIKSDKIKVIAHGTEITNIDTKSARRKMNLPETGKILLMFGFIKAHKCTELVLDALQEIIKSTPDTYFFLAGKLAPNPKLEDAKYLKFLKHKIRRLKLNQNVIFPNRFYPNTDVPYLISSADIVLFPYYEQDFSASGALHLSIGAKKPVIATRIPKFDELKNISDELLILPHNSNLLSKLIQRLLDDNDFRNYIFKKTDRYRKQTSWNKIAKKHLALYNQLAS